MRDDLTVIFYTCNRENPRFEAKVREHLVKVSGGIPIVSVSQQPIDFGINICVGDVGISSQNAFRQLQLGAMAAKTKFVCPAEADIVFPPEFYQFRPRRSNLAYIAYPLWMLFHQRGKARHYAMKPRSGEAAMIVGRDALIKALDVVLAGRPMWGTADANDMPYLLHVLPRRNFTLPNPIVAFKTDNNMHRKAPHDTATRTREIPYWGKATDMIARFT